MKKYAILFLILSTFCCFADYTLRNGKLVEREEEVADGSVQRHYSTLIQHFENGEWKKLEKEALVLIKNFPKTPFARDATFFLGVAYFNQEDYEMANIQLTKYLTTQSTPKYFEEAIQYKFEVAEKFQGGARKHIMGVKVLPKWASTGSEAIDIYDEVISALPHHELAARSHFGKAQVLINNEDFRAAVEVYQTLIRRFSKHPLAIESYIGIGEIYLQQSLSQYPDSDFLDLAELNLRKFSASFPSEEKIAIAETNYKQMQEHYAKTLFNTGRFYERTDKWGAAKIYYAKILKSYPDSQIAPKSQERLIVVEEKIAKIEAKKAKK